jgi:hypothetical protein
MVDLRPVLGAVSGLALVLLLVRQLYPGEMSPGARVGLDVVIGVVLVVAFGLVLDLIGIL